MKIPWWFWNHVSFHQRNLGIAPYARKPCLLKHTMVRSFSERCLPVSRNLLGLSGQTKNQEVKRGFPPRNDLLFQKPELHHQRFVSYWIIKHLLLVKIAKSAILRFINSDLFLCPCKSSLLCDEQYLCWGKEPCRSQSRDGVPCRG